MILVQDRVDRPCEHEATGFIPTARLIPRRCSCHAGTNGGANDTDSPSLLGGVTQHGQWFGGYCATYGMHIASYNWSGLQRAASTAQKVPWAHKVLISAELRSPWQGIMGMRDPAHGDVRVPIHMLHYRPRPS